MNMHSMSRFSAFVRRHQISVFFSLAFALSWSVWGSAIAHAYGLLPFQLPDPLAFAGISLAAFLVAGFAAGRAGMADLLRRMVQWRVEWSWYLIVLVVALLLPFLTVAIYPLMGGSIPVGTVMPLGSAIAYFFFGIVFMLLTEETAWRGFALPRLEASFGTLRASLILGLIWGVWHTPYFLMPGSPQSNFPYVGYVLMVIAQSVLYGWIHRNTRGSVLVAAIFHAATNAALAYSGVGVGDTRAFWLVTAVTWVAAIIVSLPTITAGKQVQRQESSPVAS